MPPPTPVEARGSVLRFGVPVSRVRVLEKRMQSLLPLLLLLALLLLFLLLLLLLPILQQLAHYQSLPEVTTPVFAASVYSQRPGPTGWG